MKEKRSVTYTILLLSSVYFVSYLTRNSYNVVIAQLVRETGLGQSTLALSATGSLVAYGAGQLLSGCFGDRLQPKGLLIMGLGVTSVMNLLMAFCRQPALMLGIWCVNGLAQAFLWPPLVRLMSELFSGELYEKAVVAVTWGGSVGNIALYLAAPALIGLLGAALPILGILSLQAASLLHRRCLHNPMSCTAVLFGLGGLFGALLALFPQAGAAWSVGLCALLTGTMHGMNLILIGVLPAHFQRFGRVSTFSGLLNAFTYVGSALSAYGFAAAADAWGWRAVIGAWPVIAVLGAAVCLACVRPWRRFE